MASLSGKRVLITGATGFIGKRLVEKLLSENADVYKISGSQTPDAKSFRLDITECETLEKVVEKIQPQIILHLAAIPDQKYSIKATWDMVQVNVQGTVNLLDSLRSVSYECFIHVGSYKQYGDGKTPFKEDQELKPLSPYAASKTAAEVFCKFYVKVFESPVIMLRLSTVYGPGQDDHHLIPEIIKHCLDKKDMITTKGEQIRELTYVDDVVEAMIKASTKRAAIGEIINIGSGEAHKVKDVVQKIIKLMGNPIKVIPKLPYGKKEIQKMIGDNTKARRILDWKPRTNLEEGLKKIIEWFEKKESLD